MGRNVVSQQASNMAISCSSIPTGRSCVFRSHPREALSSHRNGFEVFNHICQLRRDYASLFERYFDFLGEQAGQPQGLVIFDELERSRSHVLIEQMDEYFERSEAGRGRSARILPEPLFVHSDLSTLVQVADLVAYLVSWAVRVDGLDQPARGELRALGDRVYRLRHHERNTPGDHGSFVMIDAL